MKAWFEGKSAAEPSPVNVADVHKSYRRGNTDVSVLAGVNLRIESGQCVFLTGPSGSGKSTLLSILGCILTADSGEVRLFDIESSSLDERSRVHLRRNRIGFVFQRFQLIRGLSALENITVPMVLRGDTPREMRERATELLEAVGLQAHSRAHPNQLSSGQCQRVAMARALALNPDLILADEPTAALDSQNGHEVMQLLRRLTTTRGKTAVVVTHDQRIFSYADRLCRLDEGKLTETTIKRRANSQSLPVDLNLPDGNLTDVYQT